MQFKVGDFVVHPVYGVGHIITIEKKRFSELEERQYYQIDFPKSKIWVPIEAQAAIGLRLVTAGRDLDEYRDLIKGRPILLDGNLARWHAELTRRLKKGSFQAMCEVVRDLTVSGWQKPLGPTTRAILRKTKERLYQEWAAAANISVTEASKEIDALLQETQKETAQ